MVDGSPVERVVVDTARKIADQSDADVVVLLDAACPLTPVDFVLSAIEQATSTGRAVVAVREVTDTLVHLDQRGGCDYAAPDRADVRQIAAPVVIPKALVEGLPDDPCALVAAGMALAEVVAALGGYVELAAPVAARRVVDGADLEVLSAYVV